MCAHCGHSHLRDDGALDIDFCGQCVEQLVALHFTGTNDGTEFVCRDFDH